MSDNKALLAALFKAHANITMPRKDGNNPHFKSKYATIGAVLEAIAVPCRDAGLVVVQRVGRRDEEDVLTTEIYHVESGETIGTTCRLPLDKPTVQGVGSSITYMRRYSLMALFMLNAEDDDGVAPAPVNVVNKVATGAGKIASAAQLDNFLGELAELSQTGSTQRLMKWARDNGAQFKNDLNTKDLNKFRNAYQLAITGADEATENDDPPDGGVV